MCSIFFLLLALHFAVRGREEKEFVRQMNEKGGGGGGHGVSHVSIFLKDKSKTFPRLTFEVFTFLLNGCPFLWR